MKVVVSLLAVVLTGAAPAPTAHGVVAPAKPHVKLFGLGNGQKQHFSLPNAHDMVHMPKCYVVDQFETVNGESVIKDVNGQTAWHGKLAPIRNSPGPRAHR